MININVNPIAFSIGNLNVTWYGIMVALAVVTIVTWALLSVRKNPRLTYDMVINAALALCPKFNPSAIPAAMAITFFIAPLS